MSRVSRFEQLSPAKQKLLLARLGKPAGAAQPGPPPIEPSPRRATGGPFPLSFSQQRLWFIDRFEPGGSTYVLADALLLRGRLDIAALARALAEIVRRHEALRTVFELATDGPLAEPVQRVVPAVAPRLGVAELSGLAPAWREEELQRLMRAEAQTPFDLARGPQLRARLLRLAAGEHVALLAMHHIVSDGWSMGILIRELSALYAAFAAGQPSPLAELPIQYPDFADWQRRILSGEALEEHLRYWREALAGASGVLGLPTDRPRPPLQRSRGASFQSALPAPLSAALAALGRREGNTLFMVLLAGFGVLLSRHSGEDDLLVGAPIANRNRAETEALIGFFVNTLTLRVDLAAARSGDELLAQVRRTALGAFAHQDLPFERIVEELQPERDLSRPPLVQVSLALQNAPLGELTLTELSLSSLAVPAESAALELVVEAMETSEGIATVWHYATDLFDRSTVERFAAHFERLLAGLAAAPSLPHAELPMLTAAESHQVTIEWAMGATSDRSLPGDGETLFTVFAATAARYPEAAALEWDGGALSYGELAGRAAQFARRLIAAGAGGAGRGTRVGIALERSPEMVVAVLATLAAGAAYVPLDPAAPSERLAAMLEDAGVGLLLASRAALAGFPAATAARTLLIEDLLSGEGEALADSAIDLSACAGADSLAYVIYTSGSTGRPKGVLVRHRGAVSSVRETATIYALAASDRVLQFASLSFDASVIDLFSTFACGACLVLPPAGPPPVGRELAALLDTARITTVTLSPSVLATLDPSPFPALRCITAAAEKCPADLVARWAPGRRFLNAYGPTEGSIIATYWVAPEAAGGEAGAVQPTTAPPIGRPLANTSIHLLDRLGRPVPIGAVGEIHLGGIGVVEGYLGRPETTAASFVPAPFGGTDGEAAAPGARLYRTGDLARFLADGSIDILGRADRQVKLRGLRVELDEIEAALGEQPAVRQAAVALRGGAGGPRLVAWLVASDPAAAPAPADVRAALRRRLPEAMIPADFVIVPELPLNASGKLDRQAISRLPEDAGAGQDAAAFVAPAEGLESEVAAIWSRVLGRERVGSGDGFFDLGGHSLLLVQVQGQLRERLGEEVSILELFRHPTVAALAGFLAARRAAADGGDAADAGEPAAELAAIPVPPAAPAIGGAERAVAIVGMAGRFPGAPDLAAFWQNLAGGVESISFWSAEELAVTGVPPEVLAHPSFVRAGGVVDGADLFDAGYFGVSPREAELLDPQHRLFLECAAEALDRAGYGSDLRRGRVGVFAGAGTISYAVQNLFGRADVDPFEITLGNDKDFLATRTAYKLDLKGPAFTVQTACSTALVAVHLAAQSLFAGECEMALAGGVTLDFPQRAGYLYKEGGIASPDGHNRAFDAAAGGTVGGNGVGVVVLKPLAAALADGDPIHAVVKGSALNNDGAARMGFTTPSEEGQAAVIVAAQAAAGVHPASIQYVEAHGSATPIGDPIEVAALIRAFRAAGGGGRTALGSVKTNVGHTGSAAGIAGLLKTALAIEHGQIPPSLHYSRPNPAIDFAASPFYVSTELAEWTVPAAEDGAAAPRRAGVSSFGIGGTNVHVILEQAPAPTPVPPGRPWQLLTLSARTPAALEAATDRLVDHLRRHGDEDLADVAFTLQAGRKGWEHRRAVVCRDRDEAIAALAGRDAARLLESRTGVESRPGRPVAFLLAGVGEQYAGLAAGLHRDEPAFRQPLERCAEILLPLGVDLAGLFAAGRGAEEGRGPDLRRMLGRGATAAAADAGPEPGTDNPSPLDDTAVLQPALFAIEYALARLWIEWGVRPGALLGYSLGEYLAACLAGVLPLADALALVARRARLIAELPPGAMLATPLGEGELKAEMARLGAAELAVAAVNGPGHTVAAGPVDAVAALAERLAAGGHATRRLRTAHAFHSPMMRPAAAELTALARTLALRAPRIPYLSNVTGTWIRPQQALDPAYWAEHFASTVRFGDGVAELWRDRERVLLEIGPGASLSALALQHPVAAEAAGPRAAGAGEPVAVPSLPSAYERQPDRAFLLGSLAKLWLAGVAIDWPGVHSRERRRRLELPSYPFERRRFWAEGAIPASPRPALAGVPAAGETGGTRLAIPSWRRVAALRLPLAGDLAARQDGAGGRWLIFADRGGVGERLAQRLAADGARVAMVASGDRFERLGAESFVLDPRRSEDYEALFAALGTPLADRVVHLWTLDPLADDGDPLSPPAIAAAHALGFASLLAVVHAIAARIAPGEGGGSPLKCLVASRGLAAVTAADRLIPALAPLGALCRALPRELSGVVCRAVDLDLAAAGSWQEAALAETLLGELVRAAPPAAAAAAQSLGDPEDGVSVAYRGGERWVRVFEPLAGETIGEDADGGGVERNAVVFLGDLAPAGDEARWSAARRALGDIHAAGEGLGAVAAELPPAAPPLALVALRRDDAEAALQAAAASLGALRRLLAERPPARVLLGSSLDAFAAPAGGALAAAVAALADALALEARRTGAAAWTAIGWEAPGDAAGEAAEAVLRRLSAPGAPAQVLVSAGDLAARLRELAVPEVSASAAAQVGHARPELRTPFVPPSTAAEREVAELWQLLLGIDRIGIHDSFLELGGDSLLATQLVTRVRERMGARVSLADFFALPTTAALAALIDAQRSAPEDEAAELAGLLARLESLSPDEVEAMLAVRGIAAAPLEDEP